MTEIIDTHVHFWNLHTLRYPWLESDRWKHLRATFEPSDFRQIAHDVIASVHVQAEMDHSEDPARETAWLYKLRSEAREGPSVPTVAVGYADLTASDLPAVLDRHQEYDFVRGIRQEAWFNPASETPELEHNVDLLSHPDWAKGLKELARRDLSFDLLVYAPQLRQAADVFGAVPDLQVVVDHLGLPASATSRVNWHADLQRFKDRVPNSYIKLSGLWGVASSLRDPAIEEYVLEALDIFGPDRSMFASNYPVDKTLGTYNEIWSFFGRITAQMGEADRSNLFSRTAAKFYRIALPKL